MVWCEELPTQFGCWDGRFWCADQFHMRMAVLHVLSPTTDKDINRVAVGQKAVKLAFLWTPLLGCWETSTDLLIPLMILVPVSVSISLLSASWTEGSEWLSLRCLVISFFWMEHYTTVFISTLNCLRTFADSICFKLPTVSELKFGCRFVQSVILVTPFLGPMVVMISSKLPNPTFLPKLAPSIRLFKLSNPMFLEEA